MARAIPDRAPARKRACAELASPACPEAALCDHQWALRLPFYPSMCRFGWNVNPSFFGHRTPAFRKGGLRLFSFSVEHPALLPRLSGDEAHLDAFCQQGKVAKLELVGSALIDPSFAPLSYLLRGCSVGLFDHERMQNELAGMRGRKDHPACDRE